MDYVAELAVAELAYITVDESKWSVNRTCEDKARMVWFITVLMRLGYVV